MGDAGLARRPLQKVLMQLSPGVVRRFVCRNLFERHCRQAASSAPFAQVSYQKNV